LPVLSSEKETFAMDPSALMQLAIEKCRQGISAGQSPFGCAIARDDRVLSCSHNTVVLTTDITAHAEVNAIREANREIGSIFLEGAIVATTCEPCPMCMSALHWSRVETVYYGATIADADDAGFNELQLPAAELLRIGGSKLKLVPQILPAECRQLFTEWKNNPNRKVY
jgi:guanine deaminase